MFLAVCVWAKPGEILKWEVCHIVLNLTVLKIKNKNKNLQYSILPEVWYIVQSIYCLIDRAIVGHTWASMYCRKFFCLFSLIFYSHQQSHRLLTLFVFSDVLVFFTWGQEFVCFGIWSWWCVQVLYELQRATCYKWVVRHYWILDWEVVPAHTPVLSLFALHCLIILYPNRFLFHSLYFSH